MEMDTYTVKQEHNRPDGDPAFAARLKEYRKKTINPDTGKGYTQRELAAKIGVSTTSYNGYEHGVVPSMRSLKKLADVLQCSTDILLGVADAVEDIQKMSTMGQVARAFLGIVAAGCIDTSSLGNGRVEINNYQLKDFLCGYYEFYYRLKREPSDMFKEMFKEWKDKEYKKLDSTPIKTDSQDADTE